MKMILSCLFVFIFSVFCHGQRTIADLKPQHANVLKEFLTKNKQYKFLSSSVINPKYMKFIRESFGETFKPYYQVADFNNDKIPDFAVILSRNGKRKDSGATSEEHRYDYPLAIVIFKKQRRRRFILEFLRPMMYVFSRLSEMAMLLNINDEIWRDRIRLSL
jgi:hypothetical protein